MHHASPSRTAFRVAIRRAEHQVLDYPRVFEDALSLRIIGPELTAKIQSGKVTRQQRLSPSFRAFMAVRSRFAEDELVRAVENGIRQYVVLGAGLDTFAYRNPHTEAGLRVFEVDHPATQAWKREQLRAAGIDIPADVVYVPADLERQTLAETLGAAGFQCGSPAFFSWLGVVPYLTERVFEETARFIATLPATTGVVLDYAIPRASLNAIERISFDALSARVARTDEPFQLFFDPGPMAARLLQSGFRDLDDLDREQMNARYFAGHSGRFRVRGNLAHLLSARV